MAISLNNLPDIDFVHKDIEALLADMIRDYELAYFEQTGKEKVLKQGDPIRIWIYSQALRIYAAYQLIDHTAKMNLLKYSTGNFLDHIGARIGVTRLESSSATTIIRFYLSSIQQNNIPIPKGTRVSPDSEVFFAISHSAEIPSGQSYVDVEAICLQPGGSGNDYMPGQINILVEPIAYIDRIENIEESKGGTDVEDDESLRERIFLAPESFSVAGPEGAYEFFTKMYSASIKDVKVTSPNDGEIDIRFILQNGELPTDSIISGVNNFLSSKKRRPLTDKVTVQAPTQVKYNIDVRYFIRKADENYISSIQHEINKALADYKIWQKSKIGRDINPSELTLRMLQAGAKRVEISEPVFTKLKDTEIAVDENITINYGGIEDE